jgi:hypothetical protein
MPSSGDLTGRWIGYYTQHGQEYPITADLLHNEARLSGTMCDGHPDGEYSLFQVASEAGLPPGADEQIEAKVREALPAPPAGPIRYVSHLPSGSALEGHCKGPTVNFLKTYQGSSFSGYKAGDQLLGIEKKGHAVHYEGRLSPDGLEIEGRWWIDADPKYGTRRTEGLFLLRRQR